MCIMTSNISSNKVQMNDSEKPATNADSPITNAATVKPAVKPAVKPTAKPTAKAPTKTAAKTTNKAAPDIAIKKSIKAAKTEKKAKPKKIKQIRDSFTMPESEYSLIAAVKNRCIATGLAVKKSEVLRAAVINFSAQSDATISAALLALEAIKTGRPPKGKK